MRRIILLGTVCGLIFFGCVSREVKNSSSAPMVRIVKSIATNLNSEGQTIPVPHKLSVYIFASPYCSNCFTLLQDLDRISHRYEKTQMDFVGIVIEGSSADAAILKKEKHISYPLLSDPQSNIALYYGVEGVPTAIVFDKDGTVLYRSKGSNDDVNRIAAIVRENAIKQTESSQNN